MRVELYKYDNPKLHHGLRWKGILFVDERVEATEYAHTRWGIMREMKKARKRYRQKDSDTETLVTVLNNF